jgi:hypothetical protein
MVIAGQLTKGLLTKHKVSITLVTQRKITDKGGSRAWKKVAVSISIQYLKKRRLK